MLPYLLAWFPMLLLAVANGILREVVIKKYTGDFAAHQLSTVTLLLLFAVYIGFVVAKFSPSSALQAVFVGVLWVALTLLFEFGFGRYRGNSWTTLLAEYNLLEGRLWALVPLWVLIAPYLFYQLFHKY